MSRLRRIESCDHIFFVTTNLAKRARPLSRIERDVVPQVLADVRTVLGFSLLGYVVMPDHVHPLIESLDQPLPRIMQRWKFMSAHRVQEARGNGVSFWQPRYFDFICRRAKDVSDKVQYIHDNPVAAAWWRGRSSGFGRAPDPTRGPQCRL
jgi:REP element-mobilizing transposase RayT